MQRFEYDDSYDKFVLELNVKKKKKPLPSNVYTSFC